MQVLDPRELDEDQVAAWRSLQASSPVLDSPYLTPEFTRLVADVRRDVRVAFAEQAGETAGFFAFQCRGGVARPVAGALSDCQAVIAAPSWEWDPQKLVAAAGLSVYDFTFQRAAQQPLAPYFRNVRTSPTIDLSRGFEAYVQECRERGRRMASGVSGLPHQTIARMRRVERQLGPLRFVMHDPDTAALHQVLRWKSEKYRQTRVPDAFAHRWTVELLERIHASQSETFAGVLSTLYAGDQLIAAHMGMRSANVLHWWFPTYDVAHARSSPGMILLLELSRSAAQAGISTIELGAGEEPYKLLVANGGIEVASGYVGPASAPVRYRQWRDAAVAYASGLPIGPAAQWPARAFRRLEMLTRYR